MNEFETIETILRKAPGLKAPKGLREKLQAQMALPPVPSPGASFQTDRLPLSALLKKWLPSLSFAAFFLACLAGIAMQRNLLSELRGENERLKASSYDPEQVRQENSQYEQLRSASRSLEQARKENAELQNLRQEVLRLREQLQELAPLRAENQRLSAEKRLAESRVPRATPGEEDPFDAARKKAQSIACISNIKQICLSARVWANDNQEVLPPDFLSMSNELANPKILVCPSDTNRAVAVSISGIRPENVSYEWISPNAPLTDPRVVVVRCPIHNNMGFADGHAQMFTTQFKIVQQDGKWVVSKEPHSFE